MNNISNVTIVGLTGQTGAGKTTVCKSFSNKGFEIINADKIARTVVEKGKPCLKELCKFFSDNILQSDGTLNRSKLAEIVFTDKQKLNLLNSIMYPYITDEILKNIKGLSNKKQPILLDAPTLFESHTDDFCEVIVSVISSEKNRFERIMKRDNITKDAARHRIDSQNNEEFFRQNSDYIIENNSDIQELYDKAEKIAEKILLNLEVF